ncbi:MAG: hypothetical protein Q9222_002834 [Ikaeria aurantiellina]
MIAAVVAGLATISGVSAHGMIQGIVAGGQYYPGYTIGFAYSPSHPPVVGWSIPEDKDTGFVNPGKYSNPDIICHKGATPAELYATVAAGETVELQWSKWPESHHGPVIDYLANCNGECTSVDKTKLQFNKIDGVGLLDYSAMPGNWASDKLIAANNSWTVTIPKSVAPGNYVLRHEIIALHSSQNPDGAQNYPQCINLKVTGSGTDSLASGTVGTKLYKPDDAGILVNIYQKLATYTVPGPALYSGASAATPTSGEYGSASPSSTGSLSDVSATAGYGNSPSETASSTAAIAPVTATPYPTGPFSNSTVPHKGHQKGSKKPCKSTGSKDTAQPGQFTTTSTSATATADSTSPVETGSSMPSNTDTSDTPTTTSTEPSPSSSEATSPIDESIYRLPENMTVQQLLKLLDIIVAQLEAKLGGKARRHARDFLGL